MDTHDTDTFNLKGGYYTFDLINLKDGFLKEWLLHE